MLYPPTTETQMQKPLNAMARAEAQKLDIVDAMIAKTNAIVDRIKALEEKGVEEFNRKTDIFKAEMLEWLEASGDKIEREEFFKKLVEFKRKSEAWATKYDTETIQPVRDEFIEAKGKCLSKHLCIIEAMRIAQPELMSIEFKISDDHTHYEVVGPRDGYEAPEESVEIKELPPELEAMLQKIFKSKH